ncbi:MAG: polyhydroxyalkanoate synthesis regulator DNA-binding domain-containing protein, partial [Thermodesulfobacteriota bacterium]
IHPSREQSGGAEVTEEQVVIKKYSNRKLYDLNRSRYVTLEEIAEMIRQGRQVRIVDADSQEDLTNVTLVQILLEEEKRRNLLPVAFLHRLIKYGEMYQDVFRQYLSSSMDAMFSVQREAKKGMEQWTKLGGLDDEMAPSREPAIRETPANVKAELDSLKEKLAELEKKLGL